MTTATKPTTSMTLVHHDCLNRAVPTTKIGTIRFDSVLVQPATLAQHEAWRAQKLAMTNGQLLDAITTFAVKNGFTVS